jgi:hypothetical protein
MLLMANTALQEFLPIGFFTTRSTMQFSDGGPTTRLTSEGVSALEPFNGRDY